jgi:hypothetical protein
MTKQDIENVVSVFYPSGVKIYYINAAQGRPLTPPFKRAFISAGITSSFKTLKDLCDNLDNIRRYHATLGIIKTTRDYSGKYYNEIIKMGDDLTEEDQFKVSSFKGGSFEKVLDRTQALYIYDELVSTEYLDEQATELNRLITLIDEKGSWEDLAILFDVVNDIPKVSLFHRHVNYLKGADGAEYRIGILIEEVRN